MIPLHDDNPTQTTPAITILFIAACIVVFLWQRMAGEASIYAFGMIPAVLFGSAQLPHALSIIPPEMTLLTSMFMHGGFLHLGGNLLYLWIFGNNIEDAMGHGRFIVFYLLCGLVAALAQAVPDPSSKIPMVGASGAISGILAAYLLLYPHARVLVGIPLGFFIQTIWLPAGIILAIWFALQLISSTFAGGGGGIAFRAHIGGFIAGLVLTPFFRRKNVALWQPAQQKRSQWRQ